MLTFSNTIITDKTYLNLNLVQTILFNEFCFDGTEIDVCHIVFYTDGTANVIANLDESEDKTPCYTTWRSSSFPVIRDKKLYQNLCDLCLTEND